MTTDTTDSTVQDTGPDRTAPLSAVEAASLVGVHEKTIRRAIAAGEISAAKVKGAYRIEPDDLAAWQAAQEQPDTGADTGQDRTPPPMSGPADAVRSPIDGVAKLIDRLEGEVDYLRNLVADQARALEERSRELAAERERSDVLQQLALSRIPAVAAGDGPTSAPDGPGATNGVITPDELIEAMSEALVTPPVAPAVSREWADLTDQLVAELGMDPEAALVAAAAELGIEYGEGSGA